MMSQVGQSILYEGEAGAVREGKDRYSDVMSIQSGVVCLFKDMTWGRSESI
jgi:hypothetical protein